MGKMKAWLMDMEEDAIRMSANEFRVQHGEEHIYMGNGEWSRIPRHSNRTR